MCSSTVTEKYRFAGAEEKGEKHIFHWVESMLNHVFV